jgi:hypothetical protein
MTEWPPAPYPDGTPDYWGREILPLNVRGEGSITHYSNGDYVFYSRSWQTLHGEAIAGRSDHGAFMAWGALLPDGRRVHCRRSQEPGRTDGGPWRRRSNDGRSWVVGQIRFTAEDIFFEDGYPGLRALESDGDVFSQAMAGQPDFIKCLRDDSFASTLNTCLWVETLCTLDGQVGWSPAGRGEVADVIARLRGFWESWADFKFGGPHPEPPPMPHAIIVNALAAAGWRFTTDAEYHRFAKGADASR